MASKRYGPRIERDGATRVEDKGAVFMEALPSTRKTDREEEKRQAREEQRLKAEARQKAAAGKGETGDPCLVCERNNGEMAVGNGGMGFLPDQCFGCPTRREKDRARSETRQSFGFQAGVAAREMAAQRSAQDAAAKAAPEAQLRDLLRRRQG